MVPLGSVLRVSRTYGPDQVMHYNGYPAAEINGGPSPGHSSGQAQGAIAALLERTLPNGMTFEWTELAYQDAISGNTMFLIFPLCVLLVYGVLAAQYESWSLPLTVILIVPMTLLSAIAGVWLTGGDNNVFTQISFLVLAGLACKNAILIVEFARQREHEGAPRRTAILDACRIRLRPVLMTSVAFIMGVVPLVLASGPGAEVRQAMGIAVFAGMLGVTLFGLFLTPVFYVVVAGRGGTAVAAAIRLPVAPAVSDGRGGSLIVRTIDLHFAAAGAAARDVRRWRRGACAAAHHTAGRLRRRRTALDALGRGRPSRTSRSTRAGGASSRIRCSRSSRTRRSRPIATSDSALARFDQARAVFDEDRRRRYPTVTANAFVDVREQAQPGFSDEPLRITTYRAGLRRVVGAGPVRPRAVGDRGGVGQRRELRSRAGQRARQRRGRGRAELLRAARHSAAAVGARSEPRQPARDAAADRWFGATPASARNRTWRARRRASRRSRRRCRRCAPRSPSASTGSRC